MSIPDPEKICQTNFNYTYDPDFLYNKILDKFNECILKAKIEVRPKDNKIVPFTLKQIEIFLESSASLMFFLHKNEMLRDGIMFNMKHEDEVLISSDILVDDVLGLNCLDSRLSFSGRMRGFLSEIYLESQLRFLNEDNEEDDHITRKKRVFQHVCVAGPFDEEEIKKMKYFPRCVGYDIEHKVVSLKNFRVSKEIKKNDYPLYVNIPYVQDYVNYCFENSIKI